MVAYNELLGAIVNVAPPEGFSIQLASGKDEGTGLDYHAWRNDDTKELVLVFEGNMAADDWKDNLSGAAGRVPDQLIRAHEICGQYREHFLSGHARPGRRYVAAQRRKH